MDVKVFCILFVFFKYNSCSISDDKCHEYSKKFFYDKIPFNRPRGTSELKKVSAIPGEFPHVVVLGFDDLRYNNISWGNCGGSLVSERFVLTARYCSKNDEFLRLVLKYVKAGVTNLNSMEDDPNVQTFNIAEINNYPEEPNDPKGLYHQISLLKLDRPVVFTKYVRPACFYNSFNLPKYVEVSAVGFGCESRHEWTNSEQLNKVYLDLFSHDECKNYTHKENAHKSFNYTIFDKLVVCAGGRSVKKNTCNGDGGSSLNVLNKDNNNYDIVGIISFSIDIREPINGTTVYTSIELFPRVAAYIPWIESIIWPCEPTHTLNAEEFDEYISIYGKPPKEFPCPIKIIPNHTNTDTDSHSDSKNIPNHTNTDIDSHSYSKIIPNFTNTDIDSLLASIFSPNYTNTDTDSHSDSIFFP